MIGSTRWSSRSSPGGRWLRDGCGAWLAVGEFRPGSPLDEQGDEVPNATLLELGISTLDDRTDPIGRYVAVAAGKPTLEFSYRDPFIDFSHPISMRPQVVAVNWTA
jgi:hypothetical protein